MAPANPPEIADTPFVNAMRLGPGQWGLALAVAIVLALVIPRLWKRIEHFERGPDYRIPYSLSKDYWLYQRLLEEIPRTDVVLLGDSVIWGEYVLSEGTLSHFLNQENSQTRRFANAGVNGLFPLALEGLIRHYGQPLRHRQVILHCNVLWMTSPKADLQTSKEERFNHTRLVPQFFPRIPSYKADFDDRLTAVIERQFPLAQWANHLQNAYFDQKSVLRWTLAEDGGDPARYPNLYKNPLAQISLKVPEAPMNDPERGPKSPRHRPWSNTGEGSSRFEWVELDSSLQWEAFRRLVQVLQARENEVLVVLGPFNEFIMAPENRLAFRRLQSGIVAWLETNQIAHVAPEVLPPSLYADASHPLTEGYQLLALRISADPKVRSWLRKESARIH